MKNQSRFAFYLIPPYQIAKDIAEIHSLLKKQYGVSAAGRFQIHCTIKGFFKPNENLLDFREAVVDIIRPYIAPDCDFLESDLGIPFKGHITLAFRDINQEMYPQILDWLKDASIPSGKFLANTFHFLEFFSEDWDGTWWETITWKLHRSWRLKS